MAEFNKLWLPKGKHWGLQIEHRRLEDAGDFTGGGWKMVWHTTEGTGIDNMYRVLKDKRAAPHFLIDPSAGTSRVIQMIPLNQAGRALANDAGDLHQTNRANAIQVEIVDFARNAPNWNETFYRDLAALAVLVEHRVSIPRKTRRFKDHVNHMGDVQFEKWAGHCGHQHVPDNDHWDPGRMRSFHLMKVMDRVERHYK